MKLNLSNIIGIPSPIISHEANMGSFVAHSISSTTKSAEGGDDERIEEKGTLFDAGSVAIVLALSIIIPILGYYNAKESCSDCGVGFSCFPLFSNVFSTPFLFGLMLLFRD